MKFATLAAFLGLASANIFSFAEDDMMDMMDEIDGDLDEAEETITTAMVNTSCVA